MAIIRNLPLDEYHASHRVSASKLNDFIQRGPRLYHQKYISKVFGDAGKEAFDFGNGFECLLCEGEEAFRRGYLVKPEGKEGDGRTKEGKAWRDANGQIVDGEWKANLPLISAADYATMLEMKASVSEHRLAMAIVRASEQQVTLTGTLHGIEIQARPDFICLEESPATGFRPMSMDLKTTRSMNGMTNGRAIVNYGYHYQVALVAELMEQNGIDGHQAMFPIEKCVPHRCELVAMDEDFVAFARGELELNLVRLFRCMERGEWARNSGGIVTVGKPAWLKAGEVYSDD